MENTVVGYTAESKTPQQKTRALRGCATSEGFQLSSRDAWTGASLVEMMRRCLPQYDWWLIAGDQLLLRSTVLLEDVAAASTGCAVAGSDTIAVKSCNPWRGIGSGLLCRSRERFAAC